MGRLCFGAAVLLTACILSVNGAKQQKYGNDKKDTEPKEKCKLCDQYACPDLPSFCPAGAVKDACDCCYVCGRKEGDQCDVDLTNDKFGKFNSQYYTSVHGRCGVDLECVLQTDYRVADKVTDNALCQCVDQHAVCGDDNRTYKNKCHLAQTMAGRRETVQIARFEPCDEAPQISTPPQNTEEDEGTDVALSCEFSGYPPPKIEWSVRKLDGTESDMPGDDVRKSIQVRGGPLKYQVTGWLQLQNVDAKDAGTYKCVAKNKLGKVSASADLRIRETKEL